MDLPCPRLRQCNSHTVATGYTLTYSPPPACHLREVQIGVPLAQLLEIYELLRPLVGDEHAASAHPRRRGHGTWRMWETLMR